MIRKISTAKFFKHFFHVAVYVIVQSPGRQARADYCLPPASTGSWRQCYVPGKAERPGWNTFPGCCWVYVLRQKRRLVSQQLRPRMGTRWCCLVSCSRLHVHCKLLLPKWSSPARWSLPRRRRRRVRWASSRRPTSTCAKGRSLDRWTPRTAAHTTCC